MDKSLLYPLAVFFVLARAALALAGFTASRWVRPWALHVVALLALVLCALVLHTALFRPDGLHFGFVVGLLCVAWLAMLVAFVEGLVQRVPWVEVLVYGLGAAVFTLPWLGGLGGSHAVAVEPGFQLHVLLSVAAYGLLGIAAAHALVMVLQEALLHRGGSQAGAASAAGFRPAFRPSSRATVRSPLRFWREFFLDQLPPLLRMEAVLFRQVWAGFVLLTLALISGFAFALGWGSHMVRLDHKTLFAVLSWGSFAILLWGRHGLGWRGRVALRWCLGSYGMLLLAYFGSQFVLEFLLHRG
jgi:ABC-type uncharacterized transport system permease subunit